MNKNFKFYALIWTVLLVVFNLVVFLVRPIIPGFKIVYDARFWIAWVLIILAFLGNLACAWFTFKSENREKLFLNLPLVRISWAGLVIMLVVGCVLMLIPNFPAWIAAIICILILAFNIIALVKAAWAAKTVEAVGEKVKEQTSFVKGISVDAENLLARAKDSETRAACKKVFEAIRYSDPMSTPELSEIEGKISAKFGELAGSVEAEETGRAKELGEEIVLLVGERNKKCKAMK